MDKLLFEIPVSVARERINLSQSRKFSYLHNGVMYEISISDTAKTVAKDSKCCFCGVEATKAFVVKQQENNIGIKFFTEKNGELILFTKDHKKPKSKGGRKFLILGGAYSVDKWFRLENGWNWFIDEQLSEEEREEIWNKLHNSKEPLDIILSHTCPLKYEPYDKFLPTINQSLVDKSMERWLNKIEDTFNYNYWLFGHYHDDRKITDNVYMLYNSFLSLEELTS